MSDHGIGLGMFGGMRIVQSAQCQRPTGEFDWSGCRSQARAKRRSKRGFRQHVKPIYEPLAFQVDGVLYVHPTMMRALAKDAAE